MYPPTGSEAATSKRWTFPHSSPDQLAQEAETADPDQIQEKYSKVETNYRRAGSSPTNCGNCAHYMGGGICELVDGLIRPTDVCDLYDPPSPGLGDLVQGVA